jgi:hypothetical protein
LAVFKLKLHFEGESGVEGETQFGQVLVDAEFDLRGLEVHFVDVLVEVENFVVLLLVQDLHDLEVFHLHELHGVFLERLRLVALFLFVQMQVVAVGQAQVLQLFQLSVLHQEDRLDFLLLSGRLRLAEFVHLLKGHEGAVVVVNVSELVEEVFHFLEFEDLLLVVDDFGFPLGELAAQFVVLGHVVDEVGREEEFAQERVAVHLVEPAHVRDRLVQELAAEVLGEVVVELDAENGDVFLLVDVVFQRLPGVLGRLGVLDVREAERHGTFFVGFLLSFRHDFI